MAIAPSKKIGSSVVIQNQQKDQNLVMEVFEVDFPGTNGTFAWLNTSIKNVIGYNATLDVEEPFPIYFSFQGPDDGVITMWTFVSDVLDVSGTNVLTNELAAVPQGTKVKVVVFGLQ